MRFHALGLVLVVLSAACVPAGTVETTAIITSTETTATSTSPTTAPASSSSSPTTASTLPLGTEGLPEELRVEIGQLIGITEELRGLVFKEPPTIIVVTHAELAERVRAQVEEDYDTVEADQALYRLLGLMPADADLLQTLLDLYGEQVAGYYDGEVGELVVPARDGRFTVLQRATLVHELTHALTDQHFAFHQRFTDLLDADEFDEATAYQSVIEGDATLTEILYVQQLPFEQQQEFAQEAFSIQSDTFQSVPLFLQNSLIFPYDQGLGFVQGLFTEGGFERVGEAYSDPPTSSEQIIEPFDYGRDDPVTVTVSPLTINGYEISYQSTWGELGFRLMFDQILGGDEDAAVGWGGDHYLLYQNGSEVVFVLVYQGDRAEDAVEMAATLTKYVEEAMAVEGDGSGQAYTGQDYAFLSQEGDRVVFVAATDPAVGAAAVAGLSV
jgi:hypothetical protein